MLTTITAVFFCIIFFCVFYVTTGYLKKVKISYIRKNVRVIQHASFIMWVGLLSVLIFM